MKRINKLEDAIQKELLKYREEMRKDNNDIYHMLLIDSDYIKLLKRQSYLYLCKYLNENTQDTYEFERKRMKLIKRMVSGEDLTDYNIRLKNLKNELYKNPNPLFSVKYFKDLEDICVLQLYKYIIEGSEFSSIDSYAFINIFEDVLATLEMIDFDENLNEYEEEIILTEELIRKMVKKADRMYEACVRTLMTHREKEEIRTRAIENYNKERMRR